MAAGAAARPARQAQQLAGMLPGMLESDGDDVLEQMRDCAGREQFSLEANTGK